jgi:hypothetical protein
MKLSRLFTPLLFALSLLFAQQVGAAHVLRHTLEEQSQPNKNLPHPACEKCEHYAQLCSALNVATFDFTPPVLFGEATPHFAVSFHSSHTLTAFARGPPASFRNIA